MSKEELIKDIRLSFEELDKSKNPDSIKANMNEITRSLNRLRTENKDLALKISKITVDLMSTYTNQVAYHKLKNETENPGLPVKPDFDDSFFESVKILRGDLYKLLQKI